MLSFIKVQMTETTQHSNKSLVAVCNKKTGVIKVRAIVFLLLVAIYPLLVACDRNDSYAQKFDEIRIGETRSAVILLLGQPTTINSLEVPLVKLEQLSWRAPVSTKVYIVHVALGRVVAKSVIE